MTPEEHKKWLCSVPWKRFRLKILASRRCLRCAMLFPLKKLEAHHDPPVGPETTIEEFFNPKKVFCLCKSCHGIITAREMNRVKRPRSPLDSDGNISQEWIAWRERSRRCPVPGAPYASS